MKYNLLEIMDNLLIEYKYVEHEPIVDYETARAVDEKYNLVGTESKNLFLKSKQNNYYVLVTEEGVRFNRNFMKQLVNEKLSITTPEELEEKTGYFVGCATNFGYDSDVTLVVDEGIFKHEFLICSGGVPTQSFVMKTEDLKLIYKNSENNVIFTQLPNDDVE